MSCQGLDPGLLYVLHALLRSHDAAQPGACFASSPASFPAGSACDTNLCINQVYAHVCRQLTGVIVQPGVVTGAAVQTLFKVLCTGGGILW
jgi:hypothetical protein